MKDASAFSPEQRQMALQRLTALWAFSESGLGGVMHALQAPFTGLLVGGMAVLLITMIAYFSMGQYRKIIHSMLIVLIVKAMVSPHTPLAAYFAVSFQALLGYALFSLLRVNGFTISCLSIISMLESALQKLITLTLFYGKAFWKAADQLTDYIARQMGFASLNGSNWIIGTYMAIYLLGGCFVAWVAYRTIRGIFNEEQVFQPGPIKPASISMPDGAKKHFRFWLLLLPLVLLSIVLFLFATDNHAGWMAVLKALTWTSAAILLWYGIISPLITRFIRKALAKKQSRYSEEVSATLAFLPELRYYSAVAWQQSSGLRGWKRLRFFGNAMVQWSLTGSANGNAQNNPQ